jgi:hypothetical protein
MAKIGKYPWRPTKYRKEFVNKVQEYLETCVDEEYDYVRSESVGGRSYEKRTKVNLPSRAGLAIYLGVNEEAIQDWCKLYPDFSLSVKLIDDKQKEILARKSLSGDYNATIAKFLLSANHGMSENTNSTVNTNMKVVADVNESDIDIDAIAREVEAKIKERKTK